MNDVDAGTPQPKQMVTGTQNGACYCTVCGQFIDAFKSYRHGQLGRPVLMPLLEVIGSNTDQFLCPCCESHDRERHLLMYLAQLNLLPILGGKAKVLHFAPEKWLSQLITMQKPDVYAKADLYPQSVDVEKIDIHAITYPDASFTLVIAKHVLEHVDDDKQAMTEIRRVLVPGGLAILQTPYSASLHNTFSDPGIASPAQRLQLFGQEDHVRLFGQDIFTRFAAAGFNPLVVTHQQVLSNMPAQIYGVNEREPLFLFEAV